MPVSPEIVAAIDTAITTAFMSGGLLIGYVGGYKERRKDEKVEKHNAKVEDERDKRSLKN